MDEPFYTLKEVAAKLHLSRRSIQRRIEIGELGCYRDGAMTLVSDTQLRDYLKRHVVDPSEVAPLPRSQASQRPPGGSQWSRKGALEPL